MIPSQQAMMLETALAFERIVKSPKTKKLGANGNVFVTWDNPTEVETYTKKLQMAADRLSTENRKLRKKHIIMGEKVKGSFCDYCEYSGLSDLWQWFNLLENILEVYKLLTYWAQ